MFQIVAVFLVLLPITSVLIAFGLYPLVLLIVRRRRGIRPALPPPPGEVPEIDVVIACHNSAEALRQTLKSVTASMYPANRLRTIVVLDACSDGSSQVAAEFAGRGVELIPIWERGGKTAAENAAAAQLRAEVIVCMDAGTTVESLTLARLAAAVLSPNVGIASATDRVEPSAGAGECEAWLTRFEMRVRHMEAALGLSVGASGCLYAARRELYTDSLDPSLTRDFACVLAAMAKGWRCITLPDAVCTLATAQSLEQEFRRKHRTMVQGLQTLWVTRTLLNPLRFPRIAVPLLCRKLLRWLIPPFAPVGAVAFIWLAVPTALSVALAIVGMASIGSAVIFNRYPSAAKRAPRWIMVPAFAVTLCVAGIAAWIDFLRGHQIHVWQPTRRQAELG